MPTPLDWIIIILAGFAAIIVGAAITIFVYWAYDYIKARKLKKEIPKNPDELKDGGIKVLNEKEVIENERIATTKLREFEKLKRLAEGSGIEKSKRADKFSDPGTIGTFPKRQGGIQSAVPVDTDRDKRSVKFE